MLLKTEFANPLSEMKNIKLKMKCIMTAQSQQKNYTFIIRITLESVSFSSTSPGKLTVSSFML